jgi:hypothetical protein
VTPSNGNGFPGGPSALANLAHRVYAESSPPCGDDMKHEMCTNRRADHIAVADVFKFIRKRQMGVFSGNGVLAKNEANP